MQNDNDGDNDDDDYNDDEKTVIITMRTIQMTMKMMMMMMTTTKVMTKMIKLFMATKHDAVQHIPTSGLPEYASVRHLDQEKLSAAQTECNKGNNLVSCAFKAVLISENAIRIGDR
ncbi:hypothetical protein PoB_005469700 [Plakobranchus ocellatus]|uniref:Uncharacterized protein n=1 Tax=Plakobranchus ocellatus TaxID=259542 RepID=A0AAV4CA00_9GAST|nr:hypothetical protein PoB_005469700 [Plakobranchus ocellatus]